MPTMYSKTRLQVIYSRPTEDLYKSYSRSKTPRFSPDDENRYVTLSYKETDTAFHEVFNEEGEIVSLQFHYIANEPPSISEHFSSSEYHKVTSLDFYGPLNFNWAIKLIHQISSNCIGKLSIRFCHNSLTGPLPILDIDIENFVSSAVRDLKISYDHILAQKNEKEKAKEKFIFFNVLIFLQKSSVWFPNLKNLYLHMPFNIKLNKSLKEDFFLFFNHMLGTYLENPVEGFTDFASIERKPKKKAEAEAHEMYNYQEEVINISDSDEDYELKIDEDGKDQDESEIENLEEKSEEFKLFAKKNENENEINYEHEEELHEEDEKNIDSFYCPEDPTSVSTDTDTTPSPIISPTLPMSMGILQNNLVPPPPESTASVATDILDNSTFVSSTTTTNEKESSNSNVTTEKTEIDKSKSQNKEPEEEERTTENKSTPQNVVNNTNGNGNNSKINVIEVISSANKVQNFKTTISISKSLQPSVSSSSSSSSNNGTGILQQNLNNNQFPFDPRRNSAAYNFMRPPPFKQPLPSPRISESIMSPPRRPPTPLQLFMGHKFSPPLAPPPQRSPLSFVNHNNFDQISPQPQMVNFNVRFRPPPGPPPPPFFNPPSPVPPPPVSQFWPINTPPPTTSPTPQNGNEHLNMKYVPNPNFTPQNGNLNQNRTPSPSIITPASAPPVTTQINMNNLITISTTTTKASSELNNNNKIRTPPPPPILSNIIAAAAAAATRTIPIAPPPPEIKDWSSSSSSPVYSHSNSQNSNGSDSDDEKEYKLHKIKSNSDEKESEPKPEEIVYKRRCAFSQDNKDSDSSSDDEYEPKSKRKYGYRFRSPNRSPRH